MDDLGHTREYLEQAHKDTFAAGGRISNMLMGGNGKRGYLPELKGTYRDDEASLTGEFNSATGPDGAFGRAKTAAMLAVMMEKSSASNDIRSHLRDITQAVKEAEFEGTLLAYDMRAGASKSNPSKLVSDMDKQTIRVLKKYGRSINSISKLYQKGFKNFRQPRRTLEKTLKKNRKSFADALKKVSGGDYEIMEQELETGLGGEKTKLNQFYDSWYYDNFEPGFRSEREKALIFFKRLLEFSGLMEIGNSRAKSSEKSAELLTRKIADATRNETRNIIRDVKAEIVEGHKDSIIPRVGGGWVGGEGRLKVAR